MGVYLLDGVFANIVGIGCPVSHISLGERIMVAGSYMRGKQNSPKTSVNNNDKMRTWKSMLTNEINSNECEEVNNQTEMKLK